MSEPAKEETMSTEQNKQATLRLYELLNAGDASGVGDLVTADYVEHDPLPGQGDGREGVVDRFSMLLRGLAPRFTVEDVVAEGDKVVVRWTNAGTHAGEFAGIPPTGKAFTIGGIDIYRVRDGLLCEHWHQLDQLSMLGQLGLIPEPAA
jgi:predicted ester cyclase